MPGISLDEMLGIYAEDSAHTSGDFGMQILAVRNDTPGSLVSADGDYTPLQVDSSGNLRISGTFSSNAEYAEDSAHTTGDTGVFQLAVANHTEGALHSTDGDYAAFQVDASGRLRVLQRDLASGTDSVTAVQATHDNLNVNANLQVGDADHAIGNPLFVSGTIADDAVDSGSPVKVGMRALDGALAAISATGDRADLIGDMYRRVWMNSSRNIAIQNTNASVTGTAAEVLASPLAGRREVTIQNRSNEDVYIGDDGTVTSANGLVLPKKTSVTLELGEDINIFMISSGGSADVRFLESA